MIATYFAVKDEHGVQKYMEKVSFIVRTCKRPQVLRHSLESIRKQTYQNIEVVVVEDGPNTAEHMIKTEFADMDIKYYNTGKKAGRAKAGNMALGIASGKYLNFLDDDDLIYPQHTEILVQNMKKSQKKAVYAIAQEAPSYYSKKAGNYITLCKYIRYNQPFNRLYFTMSNFMPIQTVMFHRELYEQYGGFRENMDSLEDWDLWLRYVAHEDFGYVNEVTSLYRVPLMRFKRDKTLFQAYYQAREIFEEYEYPYNFKQCNEELNYILNEIRTPKWKKVIKRFLKEIYSK